MDYVKRSEFEEFKKIVDDRLSELEGRAFSGDARPSVAFSPTGPGEESVTSGGSNEEFRPLGGNPKPNHPYPEDEAKAEVEEISSSDVGSLDDVLGGHH